MINAAVLKKISVLVAAFAGQVRRYRKVRLPLRKAEDVRSLPVMTRADVKVFAAAGPVTGAFNVTATSGSTGSRLVVAQSREAHRVHLHRLARIYRSIGARSGEVCLNLCSHELNSGGRLMEEGYKAAGAGVIPLGGISSPQRLDEAAGLVKALRPTIVNAYTNQLFSFFSRIGRGHSIRKCVVNGEPLWPAYRERIEKLGGVQVHDHYGAMEVSGFAIAPRHDDPWMKVFPDGLLLEVLGDDGACSDEGTGALLVTDLENSCMPFIRYQLGDRVELARRKGVLWLRVLSRTEDSILVNGVVAMKSLMIRTVNDVLGHPDFFFDVIKDAKTYQDTLVVHVPPAGVAIGPRLARALVLVCGIDPCVVTRPMGGDVPRTVNGKICYFPGRGVAHG